MGKPFAMMESRLILGTMVQNMDAVVPEDYQPQFLAELSMHPKGGLPIIVRPRNPADVSLGSPEQRATLEEPAPQS